MTMKSSDNIAARWAKRLPSWMGSAGMCVLSAGGLVSMSVFAADEGQSTDNSAGSLETIVVTAQKRAENIQSVPVTVSAITGDVLDQRQITDFYGVAEALPNVTFRTDNGTAHIAIRGLSFDTIIAEEAEARVAYHVDGIYISQPANIPGTFFDVDRIEVLYGPQGTLFGRNAVGGAVNLITRDPTDKFEGYLQSDTGNYSSEAVQGGIGGPITDTVSGRIAFSTDQHSGYGYNITNHIDIDNQDSRAVRGKLKFQLGSDASLVVSADVSKDNSRTGFDLTGKLLPNVPLTGVALGGQSVDPNNPRDTYTDTVPRTILDFYGFAAAMNWDLQNGYKVVSLTSLRHGETNYILDTDQTSIQITSPTQYGELSQQISEEIRLQNDFDRGHWLVGGYYFKEQYQERAYGPLDAQVFADAPAPFTSAGIWYGGAVYTRALAAFAQGTYNFTDSLSLVLGARYSSDHKELRDQYVYYDFSDAYNPGYFYNTCPTPCNISPTVGPGGKFPGAFGNALPAQTNTWSNFSPLGTLQYKFDSAKMAYVTVSRGFKSGGYNLSTGGPSFKPETITDYEGGFKGDFLHETLRVNGDAFYYDYRDLQVPKLEAVAVGELIENAATAKLYGAELQITASPTEQLRFDVGLAVTKSKFTNFPTLNPVNPALGTVNFSGNRLPGVPSYTATAGAQYSMAAGHYRIAPRVESDTLGDVYFDPDNYPSTRVPGYTRFNTMVNFESSEGGRLYGSIYIRNIGNLLRPAGQITGPGYYGYPFEGAWIPPRTYGIKIGMRFE